MKNTQTTDKQNRTTAESHMPPRGFVFEVKLKRDATRKGYGNPKDPPSSFLLQASGQPFDETLQFVPKRMEGPLLESEERKAMSPHHEIMIFLLSKTDFKEKNNRSLRKLDLI